MPPFRLHTLHLYSSPLSGCSARVKTALYHKRIPDTIPLTITDISIRTHENRSPSYLAINPNGSVPTLVADFGAEGGFREEGALASSRRLTITQSPAIISFLEDFFPARPLIPPLSSPSLRYRALEIASLVA